MERCLIEQFHFPTREQIEALTAYLPREYKAMLTFCVPGERFSNGHWGEMIEQEYIRQLLQRLEQIKAEQFK